MSLDDKVDAIERAMFRIFGMLKHVDPVSDAAEAAADEFIEEMNEIDAEIEWEEEEVEVEPVAWGLVGYGGVMHSAFVCKEEAVARAEGDRVVPLYDIQRGIEEDDDD
jgi:hypothetical protein